MNSSDKGSRLFDRYYDPSKSLLHVLAQRLPRISFARTCDKDLFFSLMHLDVGEVDLTSHIHMPTVSVQPYAFSDDLSACTG